MIEAHDTAVDLELERGLLELRCAWHPTLFGTELTMREGRTPTYGICPECRAKMREQNELPKK